MIGLGRKPRRPQVGFPGIHDANRAPWRVPIAGVSSGMQRIRAVIADDHDAIRAGLCALLSCEADIEVVGEARDGSEAYNLAMGVHPDVIVMDLQMPREDGASASRRIIAAYPLVDIVMVSTSDPEDAQRIMKAIGAVAFVPKHACGARLVATIRQAVANRRGEEQGGSIRSDK